MARNKVQFQKGLSERRFRDTLRKRAAMPGGRVRLAPGQMDSYCPLYGGGRYSEIKGRRLYQ